MDNNKKVGVLLVNLGTPDEPTGPAVKRFLGEFLHDKRVVDLTRWLWCPLLHGIILPIRSPRVAKLYQSIWMDEGSPLMVYSRRQRSKLQERLSIPVALGMNYGQPSIKHGIQELQGQGVERIIVLPLYPQYSSSTNAAVFDRMAKSLKSIPVLPDITFIRDYHDHPAYIKALADQVRETWKTQGKGEVLLCSFHGIPKRYADNGDVYPFHCLRTTELLKEELGLDAESIMMTYQSRFGREEWLQPYTDKTLEKLPLQDRKDIDVFCPGFSSDCLETLEEIQEQNKEIFMNAGGQQFRYIPCLNDSDSHIDMMSAIVRPYLLQN
ncbi:ferrochelatase [Vibrio zhugei]|uniref:Ferrochelatase n=1 Tax=Vibrio zhugei TaxID=2479546 RepID=A0ABV7C7K5_9VIBR|nr:ferrochelatase [Vibrio zhugei]